MAGITTTIPKRLVQCLTCVCFNFFPVSSHNECWSNRRSTSLFILSNDNSNVRQNKYGVVVQGWCRSSHLSVNNEITLNYKSNFYNWNLSNLASMFVGNQCLKQRPGQVNNRNLMETRLYFNAPFQSRSRRFRNSCQIYYWVWSSISWDRCKLIT